MAHRTAGRIVRDVASLAGNTMLVARNATPGGTPFPSDMFTALCALGASVDVQLSANEPPCTLAMLEFVERYVKDPAFRQRALNRYSEHSQHLDLQAPAISTIPMELHVDLFPRDDASEVPLNPESSIVLGRATDPGERRSRSDIFEQSSEARRVA